MEWEVYSYSVLCSCFLTGKQHIALKSATMGFRVPTLEDATNTGTGAFLVVYDEQNRQRTMNFIIV
jgi:hypothetical protein